MREEVLVRVCVLYGCVGRIGARRCVAEEAICECPWRGAGECGEERFERGDEGRGGSGGIRGLRAGRRDEVESSGYCVSGGWLA
jgi:hypothetical protein